MKKITFVALAALTITACSSGPKFQVNGDISGADGKMLYLEASGLEGIAALDSVKLKGEGAFSFKQPRPESPEFYRLRIDDKVINFSVDSIETLQIKAPYVDFSTAYTIEGSGNSNKIKELTLKQIALQKNVDDLLATLRNNNISHDIFEDSLATLLNNYKEDVKVNYIFAAPNTAGSRLFRPVPKAQQLSDIRSVEQQRRCEMFCSRSYQPQQYISRCSTLQEPL